MAVRVRELTDADRPWLRALVKREWGIPVVTPNAAYHHPEMHDGVVAEIAGERAGVVTYVRDDTEWEIVTVIATVKGAGVGRAMLEQARRVADAAGATRLWLITTDDTEAAAFYEELGMARTQTHHDFVDVVRRVKPSTGGYRDAYEFEWRLRDA